MLELDDGSSINRISNYRTYELVHYKHVLGK